MQQLKRVTPTLVLAAGMIGGTVLSVIARQSPWPWLMPAGPLLLSLAILLARFLDMRWTGNNRDGWQRAVKMAVTCLVVALVVAYVSPKWIGEVVTLFGAASFHVLSEPWRCFSRRKPDASAA